MTRVCLIGDPDVALRYELVSHETARDALSTYDLREPFANAVALETVSLGAAVSLLNDLNWYLVRYVDAALVLEPSVSEAEWLSGAMARAIRDDEIDPADSGRYLKVYGVVHPDGESADRGPPAEAPVGATTAGTSPEETVADTESPGGGSAAPEDGATSADDRPRLVEPMYLARTGRELPDYDLREVDETLRVRVTEAEFGA